MFDIKYTQSIILFDFYSYRIIVLSASDSSVRTFYNNALLTVQVYSCFSVAFDKAIETFL